MDQPHRDQDVPTGLVRPAWFLEWARTLKPHPRPPQPGCARSGRPPFFRPTASGWHAAAHLGGHRLAARGVGRPVHAQGRDAGDDAKRAVDAGVSAISVSNHGGNNLDGTPRRPSGVAGDRRGGRRPIEVLLDGGVRRGSDVGEGAGTGARAVAIGRAYLWVLAAAGQAGGRTCSTSSVAASNRFLRGPAVVGSRSDPDDVLVPPGFTRGLGERTY